MSFVSFRSFRRRRRLSLPTPACIYSSANLFYEFSIVSRQMASLNYAHLMDPIARKGLFDARAEHKKSPNENNKNAENELPATSASELAFVCLWNACEVSFQQIDGPIRYIQKRLVRYWKIRR